MKQDKAEAKAVADTLRYGLCKLTVRDVPQLDCLAPDFDLLPKPVVVSQPRPPTKRERRQFTKLRNAIAAEAGLVPSRDAAGAEWKGLPLAMRCALLRISGVKHKDKVDLEALARRDWLEMPPPERRTISRIVRFAQPYVRRMNAIARKW